MSTRLKITFTVLALLTFSSFAGLIIQNNELEKARRNIYSLNAELSDKEERNNSLRVALQELKSELSYCNSSLDGHKEMMSKLSYFKRQRWVNGVLVEDSNNYEEALEECEKRLRRCDCD